MATETYNVIDIFVVLTYLLATLIIGIYKSRGPETVKSFAIADRKYTLPILVAAISATWIGGENCLGLAERVYSKGLVYAILFAGPILSKLFIAYFVAPRMKQLDDVISVGGIMKRFYGIPGQTITGLAGTILCIGSIGAQITSLGIIFQYFFQMPPIWGILIGSSVVIIYCTIAGVKGVTATDILQFAVLIIAIPMICNIGLSYVGGYEALFAKLPEHYFKLVPENETYTKYILLFFIFAFPFLDPFVTQRLLMAKSSAQIRSSMTMAAILELPYVVMMGFIALIAAVYAPNIESNLAFPRLIDGILPVGIKGFAVAGLMAIIMSTADSALNAAAVSFVHDFVQPLRKTPLSETKELTLTKLMTIVIGVFSVLAASFYQNILEILLSFLNAWGPAIVVPLYAGLWGHKASSKTFISSAIAGTLVALVWMRYCQEITQIDSLVPGILTNAILFYSLRYFVDRQKSQDFLSKKKLRPTAEISIQFKKRRFFSFKKSLCSIFTTAAKFSQKRVGYYGAHYILFGVFALINYIVPYFMWSHKSTFPYSIILFRLLAGFLCFFLVLKDRWPLRYQRYLPLYWHGTLLFCLPFLSTYMALDAEGSLFGLAKSFLAIFLLGILVDWLTFLILLPLGVVLAGFYFYFVNGSYPLNIDKETYSLAVYMYFFAITISLVFSRRKEKHDEERIRNYKAIAGAIAHELRTPLAAMDLEIQTFENLLQKSVKTKPSPLPPKEELTIFSRKLHALIRGAQNIIESLLIHAKEREFDKNRELIPIKSAIQESIDYLGLPESQKSLIHVDIKNNFEISFNRTLLNQVIVNLLKNAFYSIKLANKGEIYITSYTKKDENILTIKDTGTGVSSQHLVKIFEPFYTNKTHGTGLGLSFCKRIIENYGGYIACQSEEGSYAEFIIIFPQDNFD